MFSYENGVALAFFLWIASLIMLIVSLNSQLNRNLKKIGQRLSWLTLQPKPLTADYVARGAVMKAGKVALIVISGAVGILLSWVHVFWFLGNLIYRMSKDSGAPPSIKEFRWKMKNADMPFDQIVRELMKISNDNPQNFEEFRAAVVRELEERGISPGR